MKSNISKSNRPMTNYNERLDEILDSFKLYLTLPGNVIGGSSQDEAKQALTSLIKELVEEAKPSKKYVGDEVAENRSYTGERLFNATIDEYHSNLLKALEEV